jgi:DNA-directed RNA polymerase subunit RPC12/RpoP
MAGMDILFPCPRCDTTLKSRAAGAVLRCPQCGNRVACPEESQLREEPEERPWYHSALAVFAVLFLANVLALITVSCVTGFIAEFSKPARLTR